MNRARRHLFGAAASGTLCALARDVTATVSTDVLEHTIAAFAAGATPVHSDALTLAVPEVAENGHSVGLTLSVRSPMNAQDHVEAVMLLAPRNPNLVIATFRFTPASASARVATRIRLAETQSLIALARTNRGELYRTSRAVRVTIGGCGA